MSSRTASFVAIILLAAFSASRGQEYGPPDRGAPGDEMIQAYLAREAEKIHGDFFESIASREVWESRLAQYREEYLHMMGLWPLPEKTPLHARVTGTLEMDGYTVEMLHYQSRPGLYVTGNLYRPRRIEPGQRLPAVFYVCGHSNQGRRGNKTAYQSHGIWFAKHGYICLVVDSLQLGEIAAIHHGTYRENRWWWHARGYTPAGVECWNGVRGIDYLTGRADVDPQRIAVTGISGGGAATFWIAAADPRVTVSVPVSGMADLPSYVTNRVINGHCDCMFLYNTFRWPWARIPALIAPRPMLFTNSDADPIFPMDANDRLINRLERVYSLYEASDMVDAMVSIGGHAYRRDLRQAAYRFINMHLKDDPRRVEDSEEDLVTGQGAARVYPIDPDRLLVFPTDDDLPADERNTTIDQSFVPLGEPGLPAESELAAWRGGLLAELRRVTFGYLPERIPAAKVIAPPAEPRPELTRVETEPGIVLELSRESLGRARERRIVLVLRAEEDAAAVPQAVRELMRPTDVVYALDLRGVGATRWTRKNPPNYVERSLVLLGRTVDTGRIWDAVAAARMLRRQYDPPLPVFVAGEGAAGVLAAYAALLEEEDIAGCLVAAPPLTHMDAAAPVLLNVLRVCDIPEVLGMLAPRPLTIQGADADGLKKTAAIYAAAEANEQLAIEP